MKYFILFLATGCGTGYIPAIPGSAGSLLGVFLFLALSHLPPWLYAITFLGFLFLSTWAAGQAEDIFEERDCQKIVIDEVVGTLIALAFLTPTVRNLVLGFLLFRLCDMVKPPPAHWINRGMYGGWGVVLDDVIAGLYAGIIVRLL